jgi:hypothetical protein
MHGTQTADGRDWLPYQRGTFLTAACAEYVSGHSTFRSGSRSRRSAGIHFRDGNLEDRALGRRVEAFVCRKAQRLFAGPLAPLRGKLTAHLANPLIVHSVRL